MCRGAAIGYMWRTGDVKRLVSALRSDIADVSRMAFENLGSIMSSKPSYKQTRILIKALAKNRSNNLVRARIISALSLNPKIRRNSRLRKRLISTLRKMLDPKSKEHHETRMLALKSVDNLRGKEAIPEILEIIRQGKDHRMRIAAIKVCIKINPNNNAEIVKTLIEAGRDTALKIEAKMGEKIGMITIKTRDEIIHEAFTGNKMPGFDHIPKYAMLKASEEMDGSANVALCAKIIEALGHLRSSGKDAADFIMYGINSDIWSLRKAAASALTRVDHQDAVTLLKTALQSEILKGSHWSPRKRVRFLSKAYAKAVHIANVADSRNIAHYARRFKDKNGTQKDRLAWIAALKEIGSKRALKLLLKVKRNKEEYAEVRKAATEILQDRWPAHVFYKVPAWLEKEQAHSGPSDNNDWTPPNLG